MSAYKVIHVAGQALGEGDARNYVLSKWLRSLRFENDMFRLIEQHAYFDAYSYYIKGLLQYPETVVHLAVLAEDPDVILGFAVTRGRTLDYVFVHRHQRRQGIARMLVPSDVEQITHLTKNGLAIWGTKAQHLKFNPFA